MKQIKWKELAIHILIPLLVGGAVAALTNDSMEVYTKLQKPPLSPPSMVFPIVWTILYVLMGLTTYRIARTKSSESKMAINWYYGQLLINAIWPLIFFNNEQYFLALLVLILLMILVLVLVIVFYQIDKIAGYLFLPYFLWLCFALYLNMGVWILNM